MVISNVTQMVGMISRGVAVVIGMAIVVIVRAFTTTTTAWRRGSWGVIMRGLMPRQIFASS